MTINHEDDFDFDDIDVTNPKAAVRQHGRIEWSQSLDGPTVIKVRHRRVARPTRLISSGIIVAVDLLEG